MTLTDPAGLALPGHIADFRLTATAEQHSTITSAPPSTQDGPSSCTPRTPPRTTTAHRTSTKRPYPPSPTPLNPLFNTPPPDSYNSPPSSAVIAPVALATTSPPTTPLPSSSAPPQMGSLALQTDDHGVTFSSHLRALFRANPTDRTGELVRLLGDISMASRTISAYVASHALPSRVLRCASPRLRPDVVARKLYNAMVHDGYLCMYVDARYEQPLEFPPDARYGSYVMTVTSLDRDRDEDDDGVEEDGDCASGRLNVVAATVFSVYRRRSNCSIPGKSIDLEQLLGEQVAAGYAVYSANTRLCYTLGNGAFRYALHPVAAQYFLDDPLSSRLPSNGTAPPAFAPGSDWSSQRHKQLYVDYNAARRRRNCPVARAVTRFVRERKCTVYSDGCATSDFDAAMRAGALVVLFDLHLLGHAAPLACMAEQMGAKAVTAEGARMLDVRNKAGEVSRRETLVAGPGALVDVLQELASRSESETMC